MDVLVVGSVAYDSVKTRVGSRDNVLGGSATFFGICANRFTPTSLVAVVGDDFRTEDRALLQSQGVNLDGLETVEGSLRVRANPSLDDLAFDRLGSVGRLMQVRSNRSLADCELREQLEEQGLPCDCGGNDSRPLCD